MRTKMLRKIPMGQGRVLPLAGGLEAIAFRNSLLALNEAVESTGAQRDAAARVSEAARATCPAHRRGSQV